MRTISGEKSATTTGTIRMAHGRRVDTNNTVTIPSVPPGNYYLRIEPESDPNRGSDPLRRDREARRAASKFLWTCRPGSADSRRFDYLAVNEFRTSALG